MKFTVSLKENRLFRRLYAKGRSAVGPAMVIYCRQNGTRGNRLGLTASTKLGNAVQRNKLRRRFRAIYRCHEAELLPGYDIILVGRKLAMEWPYDALERQFLRLCKKLRLLRPPEPAPRAEPEQEGL